MDWDDLRFFLAVARAGGLSGAMRPLRVSAQTIGRRIDSLEAALGTRLFLRGSTGYRLTEDGQLLLKEAEGVEQGIGTLRATMTGRQAGLAGTVTIAAPENLATAILLPALGPFMDNHPALRIDLLTGIAPVGMARGDADIALRLVRPEAGELSVQRVGRMAHGLYAAPSYGIGTNGDDKPAWTEARLIGWTDEFDHLPAARWLSTATGRKPDLALSSLTAQVAAVRAGLGVGVLPCFLADGLRQLSDQCLPPEPIWMVTHRPALDRVNAVKAELGRIMRGAVDELGGL